MARGRRFPVHMRLAGLGDGGPSDAPIIRTDAYGNPLIGIATDQESGGSGGMIYKDIEGNIYNPVSVPDGESGGGAQDAYRDLMNSTPAVQQYGTAVQPLFTESDFENVAPITGQPVFLAPAAGGSVPTVTVPTSISSPTRPGGPNSTIQTPLPAPQTNNWWLTTTNTVGPDYVAPAPTAPGSNFVLGPAVAPVASVSATLPAPINTILPVQPVNSNSGGYAPSWVGSGGGGGVFIPTSESETAGASASKTSNTTILLGVLALALAFME